MKTTVPKNHTAVKRITLCGIFAALAMVFLLLGGVTVLDLSILVVCALMTMLIVVETGEKNAWLYAAVTAVLAFLLLPSKLYAVEYLCFSAVYPLMKLHFEKLRAAFAWIIKLSFLDCLLMLCILLAQYVFLAGDDFFALNAVTLVVGTLFFILYDYVLTICVTVYLVKLRKKIRLFRE